MKKKVFERPEVRMKRDESYKGEITHVKVEQILGKAMVDAEFREKFFRNPEMIGKELGLNKSSIELMKSIDRKAFEEFERKFNSSLIKDAATIIFCGSY